MAHEILKRLTKHSEPQRRPLEAKPNNPDDMPRGISKAVLRGAESVGPTRPQRDSRVDAVSEDREYAEG
jgi:hypothetical protein